MIVGNIFLHGIIINLMNGLLRADFGTPTNIECDGVTKIIIIMNVDRLSYAPTSLGRTEKHNIYSGLVLIS